VARAPAWMQKTGMEWLFRISQDPVRLWKRYAVGMAKLAVIATPFILYNKIQQLRKMNNDFNTRWFKAPVKHQIETKGNCIKMPERMDGDNVNTDWIQVCLSQLNKTSGVINPVSFDFSQVKYIDSQALGGFIRLLKPLRREQVDISIIALSNPQIIQVLKVSRVWDMFTHNGFTSSNMDKKNNENELSMHNQENHVMANNCSLTIQEKTETLTVANLIGRLDANSAYTIDFEQWFAGLGEHNCIIDLSQLQFVDSTGLRIFFRLQRKFAAQNGQLILCGVNEMLMQLIEITRINDLFHISDNIQSAKNHLFQETYDC